MNIECSLEFMTLNIDKVRRCAIAIRHLSDSGDLKTLISLDGSIRRLHSNQADLSNLEKALAAVEIKCPFTSERQLPVNYVLPEYYVAQYLAEMVVLEVKDTLLYASYSKESTFLKIHFDQFLWERIWNEANQL